MNKLGDKCQHLRGRPEFLAAFEGSCLSLANLRKLMQILGGDRAASSCSEYQEFFKKTGFIVDGAEEAPKSNSLLRQAAKMM